MGFETELKILTSFIYKVEFENGLTEGGKVKVINRPYKEEFDRLKKLDLSNEVQINFHNICKKYNIKPMTTMLATLAGL